jgi:hypothetical protein
MHVLNVKERTCTHTHTHTVKCETGRDAQTSGLQTDKGMRLLTQLSSLVSWCRVLLLPLWLLPSLALSLLLLLPLAPSSSPLASRCDLTGAENHQRAHRGGAGLRHGYVVWC